MKYGLNPLHLLGAIIGLIVGWILPLLVPAIAAQLNQQVAVSPFVFYSSLALLIITATWTSFRRTRELHREAVTRGQGKFHLWLTLSLTAVIGALGYWFITG